MFQLIAFIYKITVENLPIIPIFFRHNGAALLVQEEALETNQERRV
jgi:hypothetical protein